MVGKFHKTSLSINSPKNLIIFHSLSAENYSRTRTKNLATKSSVTIYEDKSEDLVYFNKSFKKRLLNGSASKRSPLSSINKSFSRLKEQPPQLRLDVAYSKRLHPRASVPTAIDQFSRLSDEIVLHIFQYLPKKALLRLAQVNSRFSRIVVDDSLWVRMDPGNKRACCLNR